MADKKDNSDYGKYQPAIDSGVFNVTKQDKEAVREIVREEKNKDGKK